MRMRWTTAILASRSADPKVTGSTSDNSDGDSKNRTKKAKCTSVLVSSGWAAWGPPKQCQIPRELYFLLCENAGVFINMATLHAPSWLQLLTFCCASTLNSRAFAWQSSEAAACGESGTPLCHGFRNTLTFQMFSGIVSQKNIFIKSFCTPYLDIEKCLSFGWMKKFLSSAKNPWAFPRLFDTV